MSVAVDPSPWHTVFMDTSRFQTPDITAAQDC